MKCEEHNVRPKNGREKGKLTRVLKAHSVALGGGGTGSPSSHPRVAAGTFSKDVLGPMALLFLKDRS